MNVERFVAREHWRPILINALLQATVLLLIAGLFLLPPKPAFALIHLATLAGAVTSAIVAPRLAAMGLRGPAVVIGRRGLGSLAVSALSLLGMMMVPG